MAWQNVLATRESIGFCSSSFARFRPNHWNYGNFQWGYWNVDRVYEEVTLLGSVDCISHSRNDRGSVRVTLLDSRLNPSNYNDFQRRLPEFI